jgi:hypothetical protein
VVPSGEGDGLGEVVFESSARRELALAPVAIAEVDAKEHGAESVLQDVGHGRGRRRVKGSGGQREARGDLYRIPDDRVVELEEPLVQREMSDSIVGLGR